jgi:hypothetical protein
MGFQGQDCGRAGRMELVNFCDEIVGMITGEVVIELL